MKIEQELKSEKFESAYQKATLNIIFTSNWINAQLKKKTDKEKITLQQYNILRILRGQYPNPANLGMIKERLLDKMSDVSRLIDRLLLKELVVRTTSLKDKRAVDIVISKKGLEILERLDEPMRMRSILDQRLTEAECATLNDLLDRFRG